jgi:hypothetical protein
MPGKCQLTFNGLHAVISQEVVVFITTAVRISNPAWYNLSASNPVTLRNTILTPVL